MKKVLVVTVNWLGDAIMTTPVFKALKEQDPEVYTAVMAPARVKGVFENNSFIDEVIVFDERDSHKTFKSRLDFIRQLKTKEFDTVFLIHRSFTRALICLLAGIKNRIGYGRWKNRLVLTKVIPVPSQILHRQDLYLNLFEKAGIVIKDKLPQVFFDEKNKARAENLVGSGGNKAYYVGINPSANWFLKRWPVKNFALLADRLIRELDCAVFFIGASKEKEVVADTVDLMKETGHDLCGQTDLSELSALINNLDVFISNDSGPAHLSAALGTPTIALFGPTDAGQTCPRGRFVWVIKSKVDCLIPCYNSDCRQNICMENITVDEVFNKTKEILTAAKTNA